MPKPPGSRLQTRGHRPRSHDAMCLRGMSFNGARNRVTVIGTYVKENVTPGL